MKNRVQELLQKVQEGNELSIDEQIELSDIIRNRATSSDVALDAAEALAKSMGWIDDG